MNPLLIVLCFFLALTSVNAETVKLLHASYDPTRELFEEINRSFINSWKEKTGVDLVIDQSHGGSGKQARSVISGLEADIVSLAIGFDIDEISKSGLITPDWRKLYPNGSSPYTSTIVFLVRAGNPKGIKDWQDLIKDGVQVITPNPKTSGGARLNYLSAYGYALKKFDSDDNKAKKFISELYKNVPVLDTGARGATTTFVERGLGDVLITWENEAHLALKMVGEKKVEIVTPSMSAVAELPVAVVEEYAKKHGTLEVSKAYVDFLFKPESQAIIAKHFFRPRDVGVFKQNSSTFPQMNLFTVQDLFGSWEKVQQVHFSEGGVFDQVLDKNNN